MRAPTTVLFAAALAATTLEAQRQWTELGPAPIRTGPYTGRVSAVAASRQKEKKWYVAGADGGVWKTLDAGSTWTPIGDFLPTTATGALAVDPKDDQVLYVGTGEANFAHHSRYGVGIAKTTDGGRHWTVYGQKEFGGRCISRIEVDPKNRNVLYASSTQAGGFLPPKTAGRGHPGVDGPIGVFKSTDGGKTWKQLARGIPTNLSATDLRLDPVNTNNVYAAYGHIFGDARNGIYKSTNGGTTWTKLTSGLPSFSGRVSIGIARSRPQRLYAIFVRPASASSGSASTQGVYKTDNGGATWTSISSAARSFQATYGWYLSVVTVSPTSPDVAFLGGFSIRRTTNAGATFSSRTTPHVDIHAFDWTATGDLICGNDGGVHFSSRLGDSWSARNQGLGMIQFYAGIALHPTDPNLMYGGFQDNGTCRRTASGWSRVLGGDGGFCAIDPTGVRAFAEIQGTGNLYRSVNNGGFRRSSSGIRGRNCFLPAYDIDQTSPLNMVYGTERVFRSTNGGSSWFAISNDLTGGGSAAIHGIKIAPSNGNYIYVKTNDGRVQVSENGGSSWSLRRTGVPGWFRTTHPFAIDPRDPKKVYLAVGWFGVDQVLHSADAGRTWKALDGNLPDLPVHCIGLDEKQGNPVILYAGTDRGVWRSVDHGKTWNVYGKELPHAAVIDLRVDHRYKRVVVATQGRGAWQTPLLPRDGLHVETPR